MIDLGATAAQPLKPHQPPAAHTQHSYQALRLRKVTPSRFNLHSLVVNTAMLFSMFGIGISVFSTEKLVSNKSMKSITNAKTAPKSTTTTTTTSITSN